MMAGRRLLLVGWSGADWEAIHPLMDAGKMPVLKSVAEAGTMGRLAGAHPLDPLMLWTTLATGMPPYRHGIFGGARKTDGGVSSVGTADWLERPFWERLSDEGKRVLVCNWPGANEGAFPAGTEEELEPLRVDVRDIDESVLKLLVPKAAEVDQEHDDRLAKIAVMVAADFDAHALMTHGLEKGEWDFAAVCYSALGGLLAEFGDCAFPLKAGILAEDVEIFGDIPENAYRLYDALLGRLLNLAGEGVTVMVVSVHGFRTGSDRPEVRLDQPGGIQAWRREHGIFATAGPGLAKDETGFGWRLEDIAPTVLRSFGVDPELPGRFLFSGKTGEMDSVRPEIIGACEDTQWEWRRACSLVSGGWHEEAVMLLDELVERQPERLEFSISLAKAKLEVGLMDEATELLDEAGHDESMAIQLLRAGAHFAGGREEESRKILLSMVGVGEPPVLLAIELALGLMRAGEFEAAEEIFAKVEKGKERRAVAMAGRAWCALHQRRVSEAEILARESIATEYEFPWGHYVLGTILSALGRLREAVTAFENALRMKPAMSEARQGLLKILERSNASPEVLEAHRVWLRDSRSEDERNSFSQRLAAAREERKAERDASRVGSV